MSNKLALVLNCGSSSLKFAIIDAVSSDVYVSGLAECLGLQDARLKWELDGKKDKADLGSGAAHSEALAYIVNNILAKKPELLENLVAIGHRVVHGGEKFTKSTIINDEVIKGIEDNTSFAPLHNPAGLIGIRESFKAFPKLKDKNVAVFDTAFHQTMPEEAYLYAIPYYLYKEHGIRRYGFHGTSHYYVSRQAAKMLNKDAKDLNVITCHLGNGSSLTAIVNGQSVDTSMGLTPLEGVVMGTRSGSIDPAIIFFLYNELGMSTKDIDAMLNKKSGILGLSGETSDCRFIEEHSATHDGAKRTIQVMTQRIAKTIASYVAVMEGRLDAIVFTGGIGENSALVRELSIKRLALLGLEIDADKNLAIRFGASGNIAKDSSLPILVIPTNEELVIAQDACKLVS